MQKLRCSCARRFQGKRSRSDGAVHRQPFAEWDGTLKLEIFVCGFWLRSSYRPYPDRTKSRISASSMSCLVANNEDDIDNAIDKIDPWQRRAVFETVMSLSAYSLQAHFSFLFILFSFHFFSLDCSCKRQENMIRFVGDRAYNLYKGTLFRTNSLPSSRHKCFQRCQRSCVFALPSASSQCGRAAW